MSGRGEHGPPRNHHVVPASFIRRWAAPEDGKVWSFRYPYKRLDRRREYPETTGFKFDLYALSAGAPVERQVIESKFMQRLDSRAASALEEVLAVGGKPASARIASDWCRFVMSLISRSPMRVAAISRFAEARDHADDPITRLRYDQMRGSDWPPTLEAYLAQSRDRRFDENLAKIVVTKLSNSSRLGQAIMDLHWSVRSFAEGSPSLVLSDHPVTHSKVESREALVVMPIGPRQVFVAAKEWELIRGLENVPEADFIELTNNRTIGRADDVVITADRSHDVLISQLFRPGKLD